MTSVLDAAQQELQRGRQPIPIPVGLNFPTMRQWTNLRLSETDLLDYFGAPSNLGILNGAPSSNQVDVDLDCGEALWLADRFLPATGSVFGRHTNRRSHRLYVADPLPSTRQFEDIDGTMLLELRSTGTQTLFPPSLHPSGEHVMWDEDGEPAGVAGSALLTAAGKTAAACILARHWPAEGGRHEASLALAGGLARLGWGQDEIAKFLEAVAVTAGDEEMRDRIRAASYTTARLAEGQNATGWPRLAECVGQDVVDRARGWLAATNSENTEHSAAAWEQPIPLAEHSLPPFPTEIFPGWVRVYVEAVSVATQTPPDLAAMLVLATVAAACAKGVIVQITPDWFEPINLFTAVAMAPAERKSAVFREVTQPLAEFEAKEMARMAPLIAQAESRRTIAEQALKKAQTEEAKRPSGWEQGTFLSRADELARELAEMQVPAHPKLVVDDCSPERVASLLAEQGGRIAVMAPEGDVFDLMAGRYSATGMPNFGVYLRGHAGDDLRVDRVSRPPELVRAPALTVGLAVQPEVIRGLAARPGFRGRGLLARWLYSLPPSMLGRRVVNAPAVPEAVRRAYHRKVTALLKLEPGTVKEPWGQPEPRRLTLSTAAAARFRKFCGELEPRLGELGDLGHIGDWAGKLAGAVARIAGHLHLAEHAGGGAPWTKPISDDTMHAAIRLGREYLIPHALAAFAQMGADPAIADAQHVLRVLANRDLDAFTKRELFQVVKGRFKTVERLGRALAVLEECWYIRTRPESDRPGPGRKPSPTFDVNPLWRRERTRMPGQSSMDRPYDAVIDARGPSLAQNAHNSQNAWPPNGERKSDDCANCEEPAAQEETMEWSATLR